MEKPSGKTVKIALFTYTSDWGDSNDLPKGCPKGCDVLKLENRRILAEWFMKDGMKYFDGEKDGIMGFSYMKTWYHNVAVIDLDISRPWAFYTADDPEWPRERIMYLDQMDDDNQIYPVIYPPLD